MNLNGRWDQDDLYVLALALSDTLHYESLYGVPPALAGDMDGDGDLDFDDIAGFVTLQDEFPSRTEGRR